MTTRAMVMTAGLGLALAGATPAQAQAQKTIDDFTTGPYEVSIKAGADLNVQTGSMLGGYRMTPLAQAGVLDIRPEGPLVVDAGYQVGPRLEVAYGYDEELVPHEAFTHDFNFSDFEPLTAVDWKRIDSIILVVQSTSVIGGNDWALSKIEVTR